MQEYINRKFLFTADKVLDLHHIIIEHKRNIVYYFKNAEPMIQRCMSDKKCSKKVFNVMGRYYRITGKELEIYNGTGVITKTVQSVREEQTTQGI